MGQGKRFKNIDLYVSITLNTKIWCHSAAQRRNLHTPDVKNSIFTLSWFLQVPSLRSGMTHELGISS